MSFFNETSTSLEIGHLCCDVCTKSCKCNECEEKRLAEATPPIEIKLRNVSELQRHAFEEALIEALHIPQKFATEISSKLEVIASSDCFIKLGLEEVTTSIAISIMNQIFHENLEMESYFEDYSQDEIDDLFSLQVESVESDGNGSDENENDD